MAQMTETVGCNIILFVNIQIVGKHEGLSLNTVWLEISNKYLCIFI